MTCSGNRIIDYFISRNELASPQLIIRNVLSLDSYNKFIALSFQMHASNILPLPLKRDLGT